MNKYIGVKLLEAEPMNKYEFYMNVEGVDCKDDNEEGYRVKYSDEYISWSPKEVFEKAYLPLARSNKSNTISFQDVDNFIKKVKSTKLGEKTTLTLVTLINGFEIIESSTCVDPANFDISLGEQICVDKAKDKIWGLLGFLLQTGVNGFK